MLKKFLLTAGLLCGAATLASAQIVIPTVPGSGSIPSSSLIFPLAAPCGSITAPSYAIGNAEMGIWCTGVDGTLLIQNRDVTPDAAGRTRLSIGVEFFNLASVRAENVLHNGAVQCFDEAGATMICRFDTTDGTNVGSFRVLPTFADFNKVVRLPTGSSGLPSLSFTAQTTSGLYRDTSSQIILMNHTSGVIQTFLNLGPNHWQLDATNATHITEFVCLTGTGDNMCTMSVGNSTMFQLSSSGGTDGTLFKAVAALGVVDIRYEGTPNAFETDILFDNPTADRLVFFQDKEGKVAVVETNVGLDVLDPGTKPTCDATTRRRIFFDEGGAGVADTVEICSKDGADVYAWRTLI